MVFYCENKRRAIITFIQKTTDNIQITGQPTRYYPINGGSLEFEFIEVLGLRRYFDVGFFSGGDDRSCGVIGAYLIGFYGHEALELEFKKLGNNWILPNQRKDGRYPHLFVGYYDKNSVDILIKNRDNPSIIATLSNGLFTKRFNDAIGGTRLSEVSQCTRNYDGIAALSLDSRYTFRALKPAQFYLSIKENGQEIHVIGNKETGGFEGVGDNKWDAPTNRIIFIKAKEEKVVAIYNKSEASSGIELEINSQEINTSDYQGGQQSVVRIREKNVNTGKIISGTRLGYWLGGLSVDISDFDITCEYCKPNTCAVDCNNYVCCYNSNGIAEEYFLK